MFSVLFLEILFRGENNLIFYYEARLLLYVIYLETVAAAREKVKKVCDQIWSNRNLDYNSTARRI